MMTIKSRQSISSLLFPMTLLAVAAILGCSGGRVMPSAMTGGSDVQRSAHTNEQDRRMMEVYFLNGSLLEMQEHYADAIGEYRHALRFNVAPSALYYALAKCYHALNRDDSALTYAREAVAIDSNNTSAR